MTPRQKIMRELLLVAKLGGLDYGCRDTSTGEEIEAAFDLFQDSDDFNEVECEFRGGKHITGLPTPYNRHYETRAVAAQCCDGSWVGWTYYYGGGKHGDPESVPWIENAYDLVCTEEEKLVVVRTWNRIDSVSNEVSS